MDKQEYFRIRNLIRDHIRNNVRFLSRNCFREATRNFGKLFRDYSRKMLRLCRN